VYLSIRSRSRARGRRERSGAGFGFIRKSARGIRFARERRVRQCDARAIQDRDWHKRQRPLPSCQDRSYRRTLRAGIRQVDPGDRDRQPPRFAGASAEPAGKGGTVSPRIMATVDLTFAHDWTAEILPTRPYKLPRRMFVYPRYAEEVERGAL